MCVSTGRRPARALSRDRSRHAMFVVTVHPVPQCLLRHPVEPGRFSPWNVPRGLRRWPEGGDHRAVLGAAGNLTQRFRRVFRSTHLNGPGHGVVPLCESCRSAQNRTTSLLKKVFGHPAYARLIRFRRRPRTIDSKPAPYGFFSTNRSACVGVFQQTATADSAWQVAHYG